MKRVAHTPRQDWQKKCEALGFSFYDVPSEKGEPYWRESAAYEFSLVEIEQLERETKELFDRCMEAVDYIVRRERFKEFGIPEVFWAEVRRSWDEDDATVFGRFDLVWRGDGSPAKLLEFNADTPTSLLEASVVQWHWMKELFGDRADQFNSIHEQLIEQWRHIRTRRWRLPEGAPLYMASLHDSGDGKLIVEDYENVAYMAETVKAAGFEPRHIYMEDIAYDHEHAQFIDGAGRPIRHLFKLYPWEWMVRETYAEQVLAAGKRTQWVEPIWKMLLSNKQLLVVLHELFPGHPNILPAAADASGLGAGAFVKKPKLGREGANVTIQEASGAVLEHTGGVYGEEGCIYQAYCAVPVFDGFHPVVGSWVVGDTPAGIGIRETSSKITGDLAFFVPHSIK